MNLFVISERVLRIWVNKMNEEFIDLVLFLWKFVFLFIGNMYDVDDLL